MKYKPNLLWAVSNCNPQIQADNKFQWHSVFNIHWNQNNHALRCHKTD